MKSSPSPASKLVFIDRDGVINVDLGGYVTRPEEFRFERGAVAALKKFSGKGYKIIVISNQAGVGDGVFMETQLEAVQQHMVEALKKENVPIAGTYYCLHGKQAGCKCRKPEIGLFKKAVRHIHFDRRTTFFIGDKATDVEAGRRFGIRTIMVRTGHGQIDEKKLTKKLKPYAIVNRLSGAVKLLRS